MNVNGRELLEIIEASLIDVAPLPAELELLPDVVVSFRSLGRFQHGQQLNLHEAWEVMSFPDPSGAWKIVPLQRGRLVVALAHSLPSHHLRAADLWHEKAMGILTALFVSTPPGQS